MKKKILQFDIGDEDEDTMIPIEVVNKIVHDFLKQVPNDEQFILFFLARV